MIPAPAALLASRPSYLVDQHNVELFEQPLPDTKPLELWQSCPAIHPEPWSSRHAHEQPTGRHAVPQPPWAQQDAPEKAPTEVHTSGADADLWALYKEWSADILIDDVDGLMPPLQ